MFQQPDTVIPDPNNPLDWNRYSYARYNPIRYTDPIGHANRDMNGPGCSDEICRVGAKIGASVYHVVKDINPKKVSVIPGTPTLTEKIMQGDMDALTQLLIPSHIGGRLQLEGSFTIIVGVSVGVGVNVVYNRNSDELAANVDWAIEGGGGFGAGASGTGGLLVGWGSSSVEDATKGFSGIISGTAAAEAAVSAAMTVPIDEKGLHVDPYSGQVPPTVYIGGGAGGGYAGLGGGVNGPFGIFKDLTPLLPWHWFR